ncbi:hypothetical protein V8E36_000501 [Tilletia maclaganii]
MAAPTFQLGRFEALQRLIQAGIQEPHRAARSNEWFVGVTRLKADLATLGSVAGPAEAERKEIESGRITVGGATVSLSQDFVQSALRVSKEINVSERYAAFLLQEAALQEARWGRSASEVACLLFHLEQQNALACLTELLQGLLVLRTSVDEIAVEAYKTVAGVIQDILSDSAARGASLPTRLLNFIDSENAAIDRIDTVLRTGQLGFPEGFYTERAEWLQQNRKAAASSLYLLATTRILSSDGILETLRWLQKILPESRDPVVVYVLTTVLAALDTAIDTEAGLRVTGQIGLAELFADKNFVTATHADITTKAWKYSDLKNVVLLAWAHVLALALPRSTSLKADLGAKHSDPAVLAQTAITGGDAPDALGAFAFLQINVLSFRQKVLDVLDGEFDTAGDAEAFVGDIDRMDAALGDGVGQDFQLEVLERVNAYCIAVADSFLPVLRKLQRAEEDAAFSTTRATQRPGVEIAHRRHDIQALFDVIATVCRSRPDSGRRFCLTPEGRTSRFLNWALDVRDFRHEQGLFNMLISISAGPESAWIIHSNVLGAAGPSTDGRLTSWPRLFDWVQHYIDTFSAQVSAGRSAQPVLPDNEVTLLKSFLALLRNIVYFSEAALTAIHESQDLQALPRLFTLAQHRVPLPLRAALFDALAAFARPNHNCADAVTSDLWALLDSVYTVPAIEGRHPMTGHYSVLEDIASIEAAEHTFPATTSFIGLLSAMIQPTTRGSRAAGLKSASGQLVSSQSRLRREQITAAHDLTPYIDFVVNHTLLRHSDRDFRLHTERWRLIATCLHFLLECLRTYSLAELYSVNETGLEGAQNPEVLRRQIKHPGFEVMKRMLQDQKLGKEILSILNPSPTPGYEAVDQQRAQTIFFAHSVRASLGLLSQTLRLQSEFLELLLPSAAKLTGLTPDLLAKVGNIAAYQSFDVQLQRNHESVIQIALFILCEQQDIATMAAQLLGLIAKADFFSTIDQVALAVSRRVTNRLVGLLEVSEEADRVRAGAVRQLFSEPTGAGAQADAHFEDDVLAPGTRPPTGDRTKLAILQLIHEQIHDGLPYPNLGHLLLGYDCQSSNQEDAYVPAAVQGDAEYGVLHAIVDLLDAAGGTNDSGALSAKAAERALAIITDLCRDGATGEATLRFLRKQGNFFARMLGSELLLPEQSSGPDTGDVVWADGTRVVTTEAAVLLSLNIKTHLLEGFALEVHSLLANKTPHLAADLIQALFVKAGAEAEPSQTVGHRGRTNLIALLDSLDFEWHDDFQVLPEDIPLVNGYSELFSTTTSFANTLSSLLRIQQHLQQKGRFYDPQVRPQFEREAALLLDAASGHDARLSIKVAKFECLVAWRTCLSVILASSRTILRTDTRGLIAYDILTAVLAQLNHDNTDSGDAQIHELMSGATLDLLAVVRQHCEESVPALGTTGVLGGISSERLLAGFRDVLLGAVRLETTATGRANLYSAAVNFIHLLRSVATAGVESGGDGEDASMRQDQESVGNNSTVFGTSLVQNSTVASSVRSTLNSFAETLVPLIAKDALDSDDAWKTVAFTLLAQITGVEVLMGSSKHSTTLDILARQGYLTNFVSNLRQRDGELQEALAPLPSALAPLYVYQALFSLLTRVAQLRDGLVRLIDVRIIDAISSLDVLDLRPSSDDMVDAADDFFPAVLERYHDIVLPALQLCSILASRAARSYGASGSGAEGSGQVTAVLKSVYAFLDSHQDTFTYALRVVTQDSVTLAQLQLATLLIKLLTSVLPVTGRDLHSKAYLPYHSTVNALLAVYLSTVSWRGKIVPSTAAEQQAADEPAPASTSYTKFDADVDLAIGRLNGALLAYSAEATSLDSQRFNPMFSSSLARLDQGNGGNSFMPRATNASLARSLAMRPTSMASLGTLVSSLDEHAITLEECSAESEKMLALMDSQQAWVQETCLEILSLDPAQAEGVGIGILRSKAFERLRAHQRFVRALIVLKLDAVEMLLVLLLRHFAFYLDFLPDVRSSEKATGPTAVTGLDRLSIRTEGRNAVNEIIDRLSILTLPGRALPSTDSRHALIQMAARRLQAITVEQDEGSN